MAKIRDITDMETAILNVARFYSKRQNIKVSLMGMTIWLQLCSEGEIEGNESDRSLMYALADSLDTICDRLGLAKLSSLFDFSDLEYNLVGDELDEEPELDLETGLPYGIEDMKWFEPRIGLATLKHIEAYVREFPDTLELAPDRCNELLAELRDCIVELESAAITGKQFHFAVIM